MSFSGEVKSELEGCFPAARHCRLAEIKAFVQLLGNNRKGAENNESVALSVKLERRESARKLFTLLKQAFNIDVFLKENRGKSGKQVQYVIEIPDPGHAGTVLKAIGHSSLLTMECCRKAYLRGAFLASGSLSAPEKYYHLEIVCRDQEDAELTEKMMRSIGIDARTVVRKKDHVVYIKEGDQIVACLGMMGASHSFLSIESIRVMKEMRGNINRRVNCETANLNKTIVTSVRQTEDIKYIRDHQGFGELTPALREIAEVRLKYPEASLQELGELVEPKIGKSGVNHRLRKLSAAAEELRARAQAENS